MRIIVFPPTGSPFTIADGLTVHPQDLRVSTTRQEQVADGLRWESVDVYDRGNEHTEVTFGVTRLHTSIEASERYILDHANALPNAGSVIFYTPSSNRVISSATITVTESSYLGVTTFHRYRIAGGVIEA